MTDRFLESGTDDSDRPCNCNCDHDEKPEPEYKLLKEPLTRAEILEMANEKNHWWVSGVISVDLNEMFGDFEAFLDLASERLTGTIMLSDISYEVVGFEPNNILHMKIGGDAAEVLEHLDEDEEEESS
jgi:hypothetical protein